MSAHGLIVPQTAARATLGARGTSGWVGSGSMNAGHDAKAVVALVEDDVQIQRAVAHALEQRGHVVRTFGDPVAALPELTSHPPDIVVLDLGLPNMNGADFLRMLRSVHDTPILVASARDDDDGIVRTLD